MKKIPDIVTVETDLNNELVKYFKGQPDGFVQVGPKKWFYPLKYKELAQDYIDFEVRSDDVWITGIPRSGTTVTQEMVWLLRNNLDFERTKEADRVRLLELNMIRNDKAFQERLNAFPEDKVSIISSMLNAKNTLKLLNEEKNRRVIKTHLPFELLPPDIIKKGCKVIYICRYPKDAAASYFFLQSKNWNVHFVGDFPKYWSFYRNGNCMFGPYFEHVKQAFDKKDLNNVLFVFYEELRKDLPGFIKKLSEFLERPLDESELEKMEKYFDFEHFQKNVPTRIDTDYNNKKIEFVRKGKIGGWRDHFTEEMSKEADEWIQTNAKKIGLTYPVHE